MECRFVFVLCVILFGYESSGDKQYRSDYQYNKKTDAFYKFHITPRRVTRAKEVCQVEGAYLMMPESQIDRVQAHAMFKKYPDLEDYAWVDTDSQFHESAEERVIINLEPTSEERLESYRSLHQCDVVTRDAEVVTMPCYRSLPFICKVAAKDIYYDKLCHVYGRNYTYMPNVSSCYKIPEIGYNWNEAYAECDAQGAHLVILNSEAEHQVVWNLMKTAPAVPGPKQNYFFYAGFRANKTPDNTTKVFKTIQNQTLHEAGFEQWADNEPNDANHDENCGCLFKGDGKFNDLYCTDICAFICEKETNV